MNSSRSARFAETCTRAPALSIASRTWTNPSSSESRCITRPATGPRAKRRRPLDLRSIPCTGPISQRPFLRSGQLALWKVGRTYLWELRQRALPKRAIQNDSSEPFTALLQPASIRCAVRSLVTHALDGAQTEERQLCRSAR